MNQRNIPLISEWRHDTGKKTATKVQADFEGLYSLESNLQSTASIELEKSQDWLYHSDVNSCGQTELLGPKTRALRTPRALSVEDADE